MTSVGGEPAGASTFEELYRTSRADATRLAWLLTHDAVIAEDVAHDAFLGLYRVFDQVANPAAYLRRSVVNGVYEQVRRRGRERRREAIVIAAQPTALDGPTGGVLDAIAALSLDQRTAVVLRYWGGLRDHEIAEAMGIRPGTARSHLSRALSRLRRELQ
jgi:DNA-directed RNA polymerase specialized sigma24 family protein